MPEATHAPRQAAPIDLLERSDQLAELVHKLAVVEQLVYS